jgi:hypothetical protein
LVPYTASLRPGFPTIVSGGEIELMEGTISTGGWTLPEPPELLEPPPHACSRKSAETTRRTTTAHRHP